MRFGKVRMAWSAVCVIGCVALVTVWIRSYWWVDQIVGKFTPHQYVAFGVMPGAFLFSLGRDADADSNVELWTWGASEPVDLWLKLTDEDGNEYPSRVWGTFIITSGNIAIPIWTIVVIVVGLAIAPWVRFSLRALLIALTMATVFLAVAVRMSRK